MPARVVSCNAMCIARAYFVSRGFRYINCRTRKGNVRLKVCSQREGNSRIVDLAFEVSSRGPRTVSTWNTVGIPSCCCCGCCCCRLPSLNPSLRLIFSRRFVAVSSFSFTSPLKTNERSGSACLLCECRHRIRTIDEKRVHVCAPVHKNNRRAVPRNQRKTSIL